MDGFSHPRATMPGAKIAETIPIEKADPAKQKEYGGLVAAREADIEGKLNLPDTPKDKAPANPFIRHEPEPELAPHAPLTPENDEERWTPTSEDKKDFIRAVLGMRPFEKVFELFGGEVKILFQDRTFAETEALFASMGTDSDAGTISTLTTEAETVWETRYKLSTTLRKVTVAKKEHIFAIADLKPFDRYTEIAKAFDGSEPLMAAINRASQDFEAIVFKLTSLAQDKSFWKTDGASLPSKRK